MGVAVSVDLKNLFKEVEKELDALDMTAKSLAELDDEATFAMARWMDRWKELPLRTNPSKLPK